MPVKIYECLSQVYDLDWGNFAKQYVTLVNQLLGERGIAQARILDLACGTGTLAVELTKDAHFVHGIDISPQMIEIAKSKSFGLSNVSFKVQDMAQFHVKGRFDLITCTFDFINYLLTTDDVKAMFGWVSAALYESGIFVFDSNTERLYANRHKGTYERELGGESFVQKLSYSPKNREATTVFEFSDGTVEIHKQRPYDLPELKPLLANAGLRIVDTFSWFDRRPYTSESERLICIAERETMGDDA